jgi:hypothetical protein
VEGKGEWAVGNTILRRLILGRLILGKWGVGCRRSDTRQADKLILSK